MKIPSWLVATIIIVSAAFIYKVWDERQMVHEYHAQAVMLERIAVALEAHK